MPHSLSFLAAFLDQTRAWADPALFGALFGGLGGSFLGVSLGLLGAWSGRAIPRGRPVNRILLAIRALALLCLASVGFGVAALLAGQHLVLWLVPMAVGAYGFAMALGLGQVVRTRARAVGLL